MDVRALPQVTYEIGITRPFQGYEVILSPEACSFLASLQACFGRRVSALLRARAERQERLNHREMPDFLAETRDIRESDWRVAAPPKDLLDRRVEITGPASDRKMVINALNSGAKVYMADFEDAHSPTWKDTLAGQANLRDAVRRTIEYVAPEGKRYTLLSHPAVLMARPRGWHLVEKHFRIGEQSIPAALFDFGLYFFHNARYLLEHGSGPYFYLPKLESHLEARLWSDVFKFSENTLGIPRGSIKATVLIETILAAFEMHEILHELREHSVGLNCGRWDYIFSFIKKFQSRPDFVLPDRGQITMTTHFLRSYSRLVIETCHKRGAHAIGGMAAQIPIKNDALANAAALAKVRADKEREAGDGHDGTWVAHPALVGVATEVFDSWMPGPNRLERQPKDLNITRDDLLRVPEGSITETGVRSNVSVALRYLAAWFAGHGAVPIDNLMEDAATAEISRGQLWQWIRHPGGVLNDGRRVTVRMFRDMLAEEATRAERELQTDEAEQVKRAAALLQELVEHDRFVDFLTLPAYEQLP
jgi:malate synthase